MHSKSPIELIQCTQLETFVLKYRADTFTDTLLRELGCAKTEEIFKDLVGLVQIGIGKKKLNVKVDINDFSETKRSRHELESIYRRSSCIAGWGLCYQLRRLHPQETGWRYDRCIAHINRLRGASSKVIPVSKGWKMKKTLKL